MIVSRPGTNPLTIAVHLAMEEGFIQLEGSPFIPRTVEGRE